MSNKPVRPGTKCSSGGEESHAEQELNCLEEGEDAMTDEEVDGGEGGAGTGDWRVRAGPRNKPTAREREEHEVTHILFRDWCTHCMMGRGRTHHHVSKQGSEDLSRRPTRAMDHEKFNCELSDDSRRVSDVHCGEGGQTSEHHEQCSSEERNRVTLEGTKRSR